MGGIEDHWAAKGLQQRQPAAFKFEVAGIDQGGALAPHQEAVVGGVLRPLCGIDVAHMGHGHRRLARF